MSWETINPGISNLPIISKNLDFNSNFSYCINVDILEFSKITDKKYWLEKIKSADWRAAKYLYRLLTEDSFYGFYGPAAELFLLTQGDDLISFCTFANKDEIDDTELEPWIGFVYTFPQHRGKRRIGKLIEYIHHRAKKAGFKNIYISTDQQGLYENFGFTYLTTMQNRWNEDTLVYQMKIEKKDFSDIIGKTVKGKIDRPLGSSHPRHKEMIYPINYGYVENLFAADGAEQDVYVFGTDKALDSYQGKVIAVYHRLNDVEDKWIVSLDDTPLSDQEILKAIEFQEQYFMGELYR